MVTIAHAHTRVKGKLPHEYGPQFWHVSSRRGEDIRCLLCEAPGGPFRHKTAGGLFPAPSFLQNYPFLMPVMRGTSPSATLARRCRLRTFGRS